jgi:hypothetical protein
MKTNKKQTTRGRPKTLKDSERKENRCVRVSADDMELVVKNFGSLQKMIDERLAHLRRGW